MRPPEDPDEEDDLCGCRDCSYKWAIEAEASALQAARGCSVPFAYSLLRKRERRKRQKLMESWRRAKWWRHMLRKGRVRHVHVHARHVVRARREEHELHEDIFGTDSRRMNCELCTVRGSGVYRAWYRVNEVSAAMRVYSERCDVIPYPLLLLVILSPNPLTSHHCGSHHCMTLFYSIT